MGARLQSDVSAGKKAKKGAEVQVAGYEVGPQPPRLGDLAANFEQHASFDAVGGGSGKDPSHRADNRGQVNLSAVKESRSIIDQAGQFAAAKGHGVAKRGPGQRTTGVVKDRPGAGD